MWALVCWPCSSSGSTGKHLKTKTPTRSRKFRFRREFLVFKQTPAGALAPLCRGSCHGNAVTEGVYAIDTVKAIVR